MFGMILKDRTIFRIGRFRFIFSRKPPGPVSWFTFSVGYETERLREWRKKVRKSNEKIKQEMPRRNQNNDTR